MFQQQQYRFLWSLLLLLIPFIWYGSSSSTSSSSGGSSSCSSTSRTLFVTSYQIQHNNNNNIVQFVLQQQSRSKKSSHYHHHLHFKQVSSTTTTSILLASSNPDDDNQIMESQQQQLLTASAVGTSSINRSRRTTVGDDAAYFDLSEQRIDQWIKFTIATSTVLASIAYVWVVPFGLHGGDLFLQSIQSIAQTTDPAITITIMLSIFAICHSGMAGLRTYIEPIIGARTWRVIFAVISLPLALSCISYFINHAHDGIQYWDITHVPYIHTVLYISNFISFLFLYPSTFNLLEIAAIEQPQLHLYETGIIRITRHPQAMGQIVWCVAHTVWLGTNTAIAASTILILHHIFSIYHGDRRLISRHGIDKFNIIQQQTSIIPFAAILDGRQQLPSDYYTEFIRLPYIVVIIGTMIAYIAHPYMQAGAALLHW